MPAEGWVAPAGLVRPPDAPVPRRRPVTERYIATPHFNPIGTGGGIVFEVPNARRQVGVVTKQQGHFSADIHFNIGIFRH